MGAIQANRARMVFEDIYNNLSLKWLFIIFNYKLAQLILYSKFLDPLGSCQLDIVNGRYVPRSLSVKCGVIK